MKSVLIQPEDLLARLRSFALRTTNPTVDIGAFVRSLSPENVSQAEIQAALKELTLKDAFSVSAENDRIRSVTFADFPLMALVEEYRLIAADPARAFPGDAALPVPIPENDMVVVEAKSGLGPILQAAAQGAPSEKARAADGDARPPAQPPARPPGIVKLLFPENVPEILVPRSLVGMDLIEAAVERISRHLQDPRVAAAADTRLRGALRGSEVIVRQALEDISVRPRKAASSIMAPTDFSVRFWGHLSNIIAAEIGAKTERDAADNALVQSAYLAAFAAVYQKAATERALEKAADLKNLEAQVRRTPFVFTTEELYALKDEKGAVLAAKHGREFVSSFLAERTAPADEGVLPFLVRLGDYLVQRDMVAAVFLNKLGETSAALRAAYIKEWVAALRQDEVPPASRSDTLFRRDVDRRVGESFPVLAAVTDGNVLALASRNPALPDEWRVELVRCFERESTLRGFAALLGLNRARLLKDARSYLPFWQTVPVLSAIIRFFRLLFARNDDGKPAPRPRPAAERSPAQRNGPDGGSGDAKADPDRLAVERMHKSVQAIIAHYVPVDGTIESALEDLVERWNPLLEPGPKRDLVRDVNALAQGYIRPIRGSFLMRPPDFERITALAEQLSASRSLAIIKNRDPLLRYISLVMLRSLLSQK